jgi:D-3-phosphoglycerate dehydrogenase / 2-oxoglutarate reductase
VARVLVSDPVAPEGIAILRAAGLEVDVKTGLPLESLLEIIGEYDALAVRSETKVTAAVLERAAKLKIIGRAGVGVDNIDVAKATECGILVVNSPEGNTIAAAELTVALLLSLSRNIPQAHASMKNGEWKRSKFVGVEVYGKTVGVVGLGKIGREVAKRLRAMEMQILAYDPFVTSEQATLLGVQLVDLETIYRRSDFITVHVPKTKETTNLISDAQLELMRDGTRLINVARGGIYDEAAVLRALESGKLAGAALDVWESEPVASDSPLALHPNVVATPHLGASTAEAQVGVSVDIAEQIVAVLSGGSAKAAVNMPSLPADILVKTAPYLRLAEKLGSVKSQLARGSVTAVEVRYEGEFEPAQTVHITRAVLKGLLAPAHGEAVNYVNAPALAASKGIKVTESKGPRSDEYERQLTVLATDERGTHAVTGTIYGKSDPHIVYLDTYPVDFRPEGHHLMIRNNDRPGRIGLIGTLLGEASVNIAGMYVGRDAKDGTAVMAISIDSPAPPEVLESVRAMEGILSVRQISL